MAIYEYLKKMFSPKLFGTRVWHSYRTQYATIGMEVFWKDFNLFLCRFFFSIFASLFNFSSEMNLCMNFFSASNSLMSYSLLLNNSFLFFFSISLLYSFTSLLTINCFSSLDAFKGITEGRAKLEVSENYEKVWRIQIIGGVPSDSVGLPSRSSWQLL